MNRAIASLGRASEKSIPYEKVRAHPKKTGRL